jgi:hypothetical protein
MFERNTVEYLKIGWNAEMVEMDLTIKRKKLQFLNTRQYFSCLLLIKTCQMIWFLMHILHTLFFFI